MPRVSEKPFSPHWLAFEPPEEQREAMQVLSPEQLLKFQHEWEWWARDEQKPPPGDWRNWLYLGGHTYCRSCAFSAPVPSSTFLLWLRARTAILSSPTRRPKRQP